MATLMSVSVSTVPPYSGPGRPPTQVVDRDREVGESRFVHRMLARRRVALTVEVEQLEHEAVEREVDGGEVGRRLDPADPGRPLVGWDQLPLVDETEQALVEATAADEVGDGNPIQLNRTPLLPANCPAPPCVPRPGAAPILLTRARC